MTQRSRMPRAVRSLVLPLVVWLAICGPVPSSRGEEAGAPGPERVEPQHSGGTLSGLTEAFDDVVTALARGERSSARKRLQRAKREGGSPLANTVLHLLGARTAKAETVGKSISREVAGEAVASLRAALPAATSKDARDELRTLLCHLKLVTGSDVRDLAALRAAVAEAAGGASPREPIFEQTPEYTDAARRDRVAGTVSAELLLDREGCVASVQIRRGLGYGLDEEVRSTFFWTVFEPRLVEGEPSPFLAWRTAHFHLSGPFDHGEPERPWYRPSWRQQLGDSGVARPAPSADAGRAGAPQGSRS